jgi:hypothetical protein
MWTLAFGHHEDRTPTHGYAATLAAVATAIGWAFTIYKRQRPVLTSGSGRGDFSHLRGIHP